MMKKLLTASVASTLLLGSFTPALAEQFSGSAFEAPLGASASVNFRVPLGAPNAKARKATYGLTMGYGQPVSAGGLDGRMTVRGTTLADIRFTGPLKLHKAEVASFDLANLKDDRRMKMFGDGDDTWWYVGGAVVGGVVLCLLLDCFDGDDDDDDDNVVNNGGNNTAS